jgi:hypothetical protein
MACVLEDRDNKKEASIVKYATAPSAVQCKRFGAFLVRGNPMDGTQAEEHGKDRLSADFSKALAHAESLLQHASSNG